ncbi:MAG: Signal recognition particle protein [Thermoanaerobacterales bacterium 50_218]|nr:MAG: Signal recognition particle protein [Thermoanaerobacterales bacterium 50_218]HAA90208.1 signal recognition particle protein [Peptococcaceae bacterium]
MLFQNLAEKLQNTFKKLRGKGKLSEADIKEALREVRLAFLEADVSLPVVKEFVQRVRDRAATAEVLESLTPAQQIIKIVNEELTSLMGGTSSKIEFAQEGPTVLMLVGLHGSGKTTTAGKLALYYRRQGRQPLLVAADVYRPAAEVQLEVLAKQINVRFFGFKDKQASPVEISRQAVELARGSGCDLVIIDTAGRLHIDEQLMEELCEIRDAVKPHEIILVVDAMTGQDAVNVARTFHEKLGLTGVILTKLDGDARGGAALSVKAVTGCPIKFVGVGEKLDALEPFHPDRMAARILGMGDVLSLIEKAQATFDQEKARELEQKLKKQEFTLEDFLEQIRQVRSMGPLDQLFSLIPGFNAGNFQKLINEFDEKELVRIEAIINSMTPEERRNPSIINGSRRKRIARGSGTTVQDVNRLLKQYEQARKLVKHLGDLASGKRARKLKKLRFPIF